VETAKWKKTLQHPKLSVSFIN